MTKQSLLSTPQNAPFAALSSEIHAFLAPFQTTIHDRLKKAILNTGAKAFLFPLVDSDFDTDFFVSLRVIPSEDLSQEPSIQLFTGEKNPLMLEDLKLCQLNDLAWQLSKTYLGGAKVITTTTHNSKEIGKSQTTHTDVDDAFSFILEQIQAFEDNEKSFPYLRAEWAGIDVAVQYGKSAHNYQRVKFVVEPIDGIYTPAFTISCPQTLSTQQILDSIPESAFAMPDSLLWSIQRQKGN